MGLRQTVSKCDLFLDLARNLVYELRGVLLVHRCGRRRHITHQHYAAAIAPPGAAPAIAQA